MLAALLVAVIAALFAAVAVAAALGTLKVTASDGAQARARAAAESGVELGLHRACWALARSGDRLRCEMECPAGLADAVAPAADVTLETVEAVSLGWPLSTRFLRVTGEASCGRATARAVSLVVLQPTAMPRGISVVEDAEVEAAVNVSGCGLYVGGSLRGRENVGFVAPVEGAAPEEPALPADPASDHAWGGRWPAAGVHAGGGIWAAGIEVHDLSPVSVAYSYDTDMHAAVPPDGTPATPPDAPPATPVEASSLGDLQELVELPDAGWFASARAHALDPADAFEGGVLHLDRLPPALPTGEPGSAEVAGVADPAAGYLVCVPAAGIDGGVLVVGRRDPSWAPVTVVIEGDAGLGDPSTPPPATDDGAAAVSFRGALVVTGHLEVAAQSGIAGHLACRRLLVAAPLTVTLAAGWRDRPPIGSLEPYLVARE